MSRKLVSFDWAMKKILRQKANFGILEGFLSELFKFDVEIQEILESEANQETKEDKFNRVDLLAKNGNGELILIEVQYNDEINYFQRILYGTSKLITQSISKERGFIEVKKVYSVNITNNKETHRDDYIYHHKMSFKGLNENDILVSDKVQEEIFSIKTLDIYPEYYVIIVNNFKDIIKNSLDEWIYFLKNEEIENRFKAKGLDEAKEVLDVLKLQPKDRAIYKRKEDNRRYKESLIFTAEIKGEERGIKRGEEIGEKKAKIEIAKSLLDVLDIETISIKTGLSVEEIEKLKSK